MKYLIGFLLAVLLAVCCNGAFQRRAQERCREVSVSGHTYIIIGGGTEYAICPSAETLRWAYSHSHNSPKP